MSTKIIWTIQIVRLALKIVEKMNSHPAPSVQDDVRSPAYTVVPLPTPLFTYPRPVPLTFN